MSRYAFLLLPSANRVYAESAAALARAELAVFNESVLGGRVSAVDSSEIGGVPYVTFHCADFSGRDAELLAKSPAKPEQRYDTGAARVSSEL